MALSGFDLLPPNPIKVRIGEREYPLSFRGAKPWALLEAHYGGPLFQHTIPTVLEKVANGSVQDILYITWCGLQHLGEAAPTIEEVQQVDIVDLLVSDDGKVEGPLVQALLAVLPKPTTPNPADGPKTEGTATGIGGWRSTLRRLFSGGRKTGSGTK